MPPVSPALISLVPKLCTCALQPAGPRRGQCYHVCPQRICLLHLLSLLVNPTLLLALFKTCNQVFSPIYFTPLDSVSSVSPPVGESAEIPDYRLFMGAGGRTDGLRAQWKLLLSTAPSKSLSARPRLEFCTMLPVQSDQDPIGKVPDARVSVLMDLCSLPSPS